jgi:nucleoside-diphosphate-sugar epimerase
LTKSVLVIGGAGYIGSRLRLELAQHYSVDSVDCCWYNYDETSRRIDYAKLTTGDLDKYDVVVLLAGHSSVASCVGPIMDPWLNNVTNFSELLKKLTGQTLIYASSASVYGNSTPGDLHKESSRKPFIPVNNYDITKYALDLEAVKAIDNGLDVIGLRFGTVNGWAPYIRSDVMINAMYDTARHYKEIKVTNKHINRALLGINDLCRAVQAIIERPKPGIYNLASFNTTVENIATIVADKLDVKLTDKGNTINAYDFGLDCSLFERKYNFTFKETPATIVDGLIERFDESQLGRRDNFMIYQWEREHGKR